MVMPAAYNPISLGQIQTEFTGANPAFLSEYYRGGNCCFGIIKITPGYNLNI